MGISQYPSPAHRPGRHGKSWWCLAAKCVYQREREFTLTIGLPLPKARFCCLIWLEVSILFSMNWTWWQVGLKLKPCVLYPNHGEKNPWFSCICYSFNKFWDTRITNGIYRYGPMGYEWTQKWWFLGFMEQLPAGDQHWSSSILLGVVYILYFCLPLYLEFYIPIFEVSYYILSYIYPKLSKVSSLKFKLRCLETI